MVRNLRQLRLERKMTQQELGARAGLTGPKISELESGRGNPQLSTLHQVADALGVGVHDLFEEGEPISVDATDLVGELSALEAEDYDLLRRLARRLARGSKPSKPGQS